MIIGIVAIAKNYAIGKDGKLPWHYSTDLKFFKETTTGNAVVMGLNTWNSIGRPLPNRLNLVLSTTGNIEPQPNVLLLRSKQNVLALADYLKCDIYIMGGAKTYDTFADEIEKWIVTHVPVAVGDADVFMPSEFLYEFEATNQKELGEGLVVKYYSR